MELIIILVVILIILLVICLFLKKNDNKMSESFYPYISTDTPEGSSALYGWGTDQSSSNWRIRTKQVCCPCPPPRTS
jgi:hypothetical protein